MSYSIGLQAVNAYNNFSNTNSVSQNTQVNNLKNTSGTAKFQDMVNANFNQFAKMSQAEILSQISQVNNVNNISVANNITRGNQNNSSFIGETVREISQKITKQEDLSLKRVVGKTSITDVAMASVEASNALKLAIELRNKMQDFIDKTMNINI